MTSTGHGRTTKLTTRTWISSIAVAGRRGPPPEDGCHGHECSSNGPTSSLWTPGTLVQHKPYRYIHPQPTTHHHLGSHLCLVAAGCPEGVHSKLPSVTVSLSRRLPLDPAPDHSQIHQPCKSLGYICLVFFVKLSASVAKGPGSELPRAISSTSCWPPRPCYFPKGRAGWGWSVQHSPTDTAP